MPHPECYVRTDQCGVMRVGSSRVSLDSVVAGFHRGDSPETIQQSYPALSLEEVYGAIAWYLGHRNDVDGYLRQQDEAWAEFQRKSDERSASVVLRLRALNAAETLEAK